MINAIGFFVGALVSSFILVQGIGWLLKKIGQDRLGLAQLITFAVSMNVAGYGLADGGEPKFVYASMFYAPACLVWFAIDFYRSRSRR